MPFRNLPRARSLAGRSTSPHALISREVITVDGVQVSVLRKKNRNMYLRVKPPYGAVEVTAPVRMPQQDIVRFVRERRAWIDEALRKMAAARSRTFASPNVDPDVPVSAVSMQREGAPEGAFSWNEQSLERARLAARRRRSRCAR